MKLNEEIIQPFNKDTSMEAENHVISNAGVRVPKIIYGTAWKKEHTAKLVEQAITLGFRGIDTACQPKHYNESGVGEGISACLNHQLKREELYLQTKFTPLGGHDPERIPYDPKASLNTQVQQSFQVSLENLGTEYLDCLVLHSPLPTFHQTWAVWQAMQYLVNLGQVKQLGISNCYDPAFFKHLYEVAEVKPAVLQNRFYAETGYDRELRQFCRDRGIIYQSFWTLTANPRILSHQVTRTLAVKYGRTVEQIFFRTLSQIGIIPLTGTTSPEHMREDVAIFEFGLTGAEAQSIEKLLF